jgi:hypothetical protein
LLRSLSVVEKFPFAVNVVVQQFGVGRLDPQNILRQTLEERGLIITEPTNVTAKDGRKRNGSLLYTICPIKDAVDLFRQRQMRKLEADAVQRRIAKKLAAQVNEGCSA